MIFENSWFIKAEINDDGLFCDSDKATKIKYISICSCGKQDQFEIPVNEDNKNIELRCSACKNDNFIYIVSNKSHHHSLYTVFNPFDYKHLKWSIKTQKTSDSYIVNATIKLPLIIKGKREVIFEDKLLSTLSLETNLHSDFYDDNSLWSSWVTLNSMIPRGDKHTDIEEDTKKNLAKLILKNPPDCIKGVLLQWNKLPKDFQILSSLLFFIKHPTIQDIEILFWDTKSGYELNLDTFNSVDKLLKEIIDKENRRSVLKAFYTQYQKDIKQKRYYNPLCDYVFLRSIDDPNHLCKLIYDDYDKSNFLKKVSDTRSAIDFIKFLKKIYGEKQVVKMIKSYCQNDNIYWQDSIKMYKSFFSSIEKNFKKTHAHIQDIHNEFVRCGEIEKFVYNDKKISYPDALREIETCYKEFEFRLPKGSREMYEWGIKLHNCLSTYFEDIKAQTSYIIGAFLHGELLYAFEINDIMLIQAYGFDNTPVKKEHIPIIKEWFTQQISLKRLPKIAIDLLDI